MCNIVGAIPGALPPLAGWAAARGGLSWEPTILFAIMFLWQLPHTMAVARLYRTDYERAGIHLLPQDNTRGGNASNTIVIAGSLGLIAVGIIPTMLGYAGVRIPGNRIGDGPLDAGVWRHDGALARQLEVGAPPVAGIYSIFADRFVGAGAGSRVSNRMSTLVTREERKEEIWRTLKILIGVMVLLVTISVVTIIVKHH